ncbi:MAG: nicotinamide mononucleotide transporter [Clostridia bacterium]|nr:nicotinamide mononucleotide transporter [Clostridia bacterium]
MQTKTSYFTKAEMVLWLGSLLFILVSFFVFDRANYLTLITSLIGATSLIFCAKGNPFGQVLMIVFGLIYGFISYTFRCYGEMITYVGMTVPMAVWALVAWLKNPYNGNKAEVTVNRLPKKEIPLLALLSVFVTALLYFVLRYLGTANLFFSTLSVTTSFVAVYLTARRSPYYAVAYALNDIVLIILWIYAALRDISYLSVIICFIAFLANDLYGFYNWRKMQKKQNA